MPKLRKENLFCESDINSIHQLALFDYIYDQQDLFNFYEDQSCFPFLEVKEPSKLFASALSNLEIFLNDFAMDEEALKQLVNLRFLNYREELQITATLGNDQHFRHKFNENSHPLIKTLEYVTTFAVFFTTLSKKYIQKYEGSDLAYSNEYLKRVFF